MATLSPSARGPIAWCAALAHRFAQDWRAVPRRHYVAKPTSLITHNGRVNKTGAAPLFKAAHVVADPFGTLISAPSTIWKPSTPDFCVLGIETSFDDTAVALVDSSGAVLGESRRSSVGMLATAGGIVPPEAAARHRECIGGVINETLEKSGKTLSNIAAVAVTIGPGLAPCLHEGVVAARDIARKYNIPLVPVHHMEAHMLIALRDRSLRFPFVVLLATGGHCQLTLAKGIENYEALGHALDDAPGEAFDKVARMLGLDMRSAGGGAALEAFAASGNMHAVDFSVPLHERRDCTFSFAGLKSAVRRELEELQNPDKAGIAASFQRVVAFSLAERAGRGLLYAGDRLGTLRYGYDVRPSPGDVPPLVFSGGVACNMTVREAVESACRSLRTHVVCPPPALCRDNGVMIAFTAVEKLLRGCGGRGTRVVINRPLTDEERANPPDDGFPMPDDINDTLSLLRYRTRWPLGPDLSEDVARQNIPYRLEWGRRRNQITRGTPVDDARHLRRRNPEAAMDQVSHYVKLENAADMRKPQQRGGWQRTRR